MNIFNYDTIFSRNNNVYFAEDNRVNYYDRKNLKFKDISKIFVFEKLILRISTWTMFKLIC